MLSRCFLDFSWVWGFLSQDWVRSLLSSLQSLCLSGRSDLTEMAALASNRMINFNLLFNDNAIRRNLAGSRYPSYMYSSKLVFFGPTGNTKLAALASHLKPLYGIWRKYQVLFFGSIEWPPCSLIGWEMFDISSATDEQNLMKLDRRQVLNVLYQVCVFFFRADR